MVPIPSDLEQSLLIRAQERRISLEQLVTEALRWYLQVEDETFDELAAWQEIRDEALKAADRHL